MFFNIARMVNNIANNVINDDLKDDIVFEIEMALELLKGLKQGIDLIPDSHHEKRELAHQHLWQLKDSVQVLHTFVTSARVIPNCLIIIQILVMPSNVLLF